MNIIVKKLKPVMPSLREKKRYLTFEIISNKQINDFSAISDQIYDVFEDLFGTFGSAEAGILALEELWQPEVQKGIIRTNNKYVEKLKTSLSLIESIGSHNVIVKSIKVSGNLKKAKEFAMAG